MMKGNVMDKFTNRYWLFAGYNYYPSGGLNDFRGSFKTMVDAVKAIGRKDWFHILDTVTGETHEDQYLPKDYRITEWAETYDDGERNALR